MKKSTDEIRQAFLDFFHINGHKIINSSSLLPNNDKTLLFTNAGMNQFKDIFLHINKNNCFKAASIQRCVRIGGKHNDLEKVGYTNYHHTFFEMMGNFSFGDYFKYEAIHYAWELLTSKHWFSIPKERLLITVYKTDDESYSIWKKEIGIPDDKIFLIDNKKDTHYESDNFWQMGDTGPCGPCTEIFYDRGKHLWGKFPGSYEEIGDRYIELWNIVFIQFNRLTNGIFEQLITPSVDTGMGLERIAVILQQVNSNYEIDLFHNLIESIAKIVGFIDLNNKSLRVIADHIRSCVFLIGDGVVPSNEKHGYALRRIIRRAVRHGYTLGIKNFFHKLVDPLIKIMGTTGKYLIDHQTRIEQIIKKEEQKFANILERGLILLDNELSKIKNNELNGEIAFLLYDTYGFPIDLTIDICRERNIKIDKNSFKLAMEKQRNHAKKSSFFDKENISLKINLKSKFYGYDNLELHSNVIGIIVDNVMVNKIDINQKAIIFLDKTPFYAESGGQIGDKGELKGYNFIFKVEDTQKYDRAIGHLGTLLYGSIKLGDSIQALVDKTLRSRICLNHSATHLIHAALCKVLGNHVFQKGSLVNDNMLRFDFSHFDVMKLSEIRTVENLVNLQIRRNLPITTKITDIDYVRKEGIIKLLNNKYDQYVRILSIGDFSIELCGGTHAVRTGDIGILIIKSESSISNGIRRIEAVTGEKAIANIHEQNDQIRNIANYVKCNNFKIDDKIKKIVNHINNLERELKSLRNKIILQEIANLSDSIIKIKGINLLVSELNNIEPKIMRVIVNNIKNKINSIVIVLATVDKGKIHIIVGVSKNITNTIKAKELISVLANQVNGNGGGRPDIAQAGGKNLKALPSALANVKEWINKKI